MAEYEQGRYSGEFGPSHMPVGDDLHSDWGGDLEDKIEGGTKQMNFDGFAAKYPDKFTTLAPLLQLQKESSPQEINGKLRGAIKGRLLEVLGQDDGRYFLKTLWDVERGSTTKLSQTQGNFLGLWLRTDGNEEALPGIVDALRVFEAAQASEAISAERHAEAESEIQRVAKEIGAKVSPLEYVKQIVDEELRDLGLPLPDVEGLAQTLEEATPDRLHGLAEAPASFNFFASIKGFNGQWTLRDWTEADLLQRVYALIADLEELGVFPVDRYGSPVATVTSGTVAEAKAHSTPAQKAAPQRQQPQTTTMVDGHEKFLVKEIVSQVTPNGNPYYAIKGAQYMKYGVTAWPEVAEQVHGLFDDVHLDDLSTTEAWSAAGRNLFALAEKPEGEKFAQKVVEFVVG